MSARRLVAIALLTALLVGAGYSFGRLCSQMEQAHLLFLPFSWDLLRLLLCLLLSLGLLAVAAGAVALLFRPIWVAFVAFLLCSMAVLLGWGISAPRALLALALVPVGMVYAYLVQAELRQRVKFSVGIVAEPQRLLLVALLVAALASFYLGYQRYIEDKGFAVPEKYRSRIVDEVSERVALAAPEALRDSLRSAIRQQLQGLFSDQFSRAIKPVEHYIPAVVALLLFVPLLAVTYLLGWLPVVALWLLFLGLRLTGMVRTTTETLEVKRLVIA